MPAGDGTTEGDAPPAGTATDIALRVRGGELVIGGQFDLTDAAITPEKLDAGTEAKRRAMRDRIGAEGRLKPGAGITIGAEDDAGRRLIAAENPHARAGGDLEAEDTFRQAPLDPVHDWRLEAVQQVDPHVVRMVYDNAKGKFISETFLIARDGEVMITGVLEYQRVGSQPGAGIFSLTTTPIRIRGNLFEEKGRTVDSIILKIGADETGAESATEKTIEIQDAGTPPSSMVAKEALTADLDPMATATEVCARINFGFTQSDRVSGWKRDRDNDLSATDLKKAYTKIAPGSMAVINNGVLLIGNAVSAPGDSLEIWAFKKVRKVYSRFPDCDVGTAPAQGMAYDASTSKLYVLPSSADGIKVYQLTAPGTDSQIATPVPENQGYLVSDRKLTAAYGSGNLWHRWGIAVHGEYLYVGYHDGNIRCFDKQDGDHVEAKDIENTGVPVMGLTAVGDFLAFGGNIQDGITFWDIANRKVVPDLAIVPSVLAAINPNFQVAAIAYNSTDQRLYVIDHYRDHVVAFAASNRAYPESEHRFRTMDKKRLKAEVREDVAVQAVDKLPAPGTAGRRVWVKRDYPVRSVYVQPNSFNGTALQNSDLGSRGYWRRATDGWAVGSLLGVFPALHMLSNTKLALLAGQVTGPVKLHVGDNHYPLVAGSKNTRLLAGHDTLVDLYTITIAGGLPAGDWNDVWIEGATQFDRAPAVYDVKQGEYADTGSAWSPAGFDAPLGNAGNDFDLLIRERIPGAEQTVTEALRTLDRRTLQDAVRGWFAPWAQAGSSADIPLGRLPIEKLTQAEYDAKVAANTVDANTVYVIVG